MEYNDAIETARILKCCSFLRNYNFAYDLDQNIVNFPNVEAETLVGNPSYAGFGMNIGGSIDYWLEDLPIAFKFFSQANIVPQAPPFTDVSTMFANIGVSIVVVLKRHHGSSDKI